MTESVRDLVRAAWAKLGPLAPVAECGSYNINGGVRDIVPGIVGFDLLPGRGVDIVIEPGGVPIEHHGRYSLVLCLDSFQFCPEPEKYRQQLADLAAPGAWLLLTACTDACKITHSTSPNPQGWSDHLRWTPPQLETFLSRDFAGKATRFGNHGMYFMGERR